MKALIPLVWHAFIACNPPAPPQEDTTSEASTASVGTAPVIDREPNDRRHQASDLIDGGTGSLALRDVDTYRLPREPGIWRIEAAGPDTRALRLDVVQGDGPPPESLQPRSILHAVHVQGQGFLVLRNLGAVEIPYTLHLASADLPPVSLVLSEPDDRSRPPQIEAVPATILGFFEGGEDVDAFQVATSTLRAHNATTIEVAPLPLARPVLRVYTLQQELLAEVVAQQPGFGVTIPNLGPPETVDEILVEVSEAGGEGFEQPYTISLYPATADAQLLELEPNDTQEYAGRIAGEAQIAGFFHTLEDRDLFRFSVMEAGAASVAVTPDLLTDIALGWTPSGQTALVLDFRGMGEAESFCSRGVSAGDHFIEVSPRQSSAPGLATYTLVTRLETGQVETEPNDDHNLQGVISIAQSARGYIYPETDVDFFRWRAIPPIDAGTEQRIEVQPPNGIDVALEVLDDEGLQVAVADRNRQGGVERIALEGLPVGTYHIVVRGRGGARCDQGYALTIQ